jgi:hypothetical protein
MRLRRLAALALALGLTGPGVRPASARPVALRKHYNPRQAALPEDPLLTVNTPNGPTYHLSHPEYNDLKQISLELLGRFSPSRSFFIGVGRAPSRFIAFLQNLNPDIAMNFPASEIRAHEPTYYLPQYVQHFEKLIPKSVLKGNRTIVLLDRVTNGTTLRRFQRALQQYLSQIQSPTKIATAAVTYYVANAPEMSPIDLNLFPNLQVGMVPEGAVAEYPEHSIPISSVDGLAKRSEYTQFRRALRRRMAADPELDRALSKLPEVNLMVPESDAD